MMIAEKLLACCCAATRPSTIFLANWAGPAGSDLHADIGAVELPASGALTGSGTALIYAGPGANAVLSTAAHDGLGAWVLEAFFYGATPPIVLIENSTAIGVYQGQIRFGGQQVGIAGIAVSGLNHIAIGVQGGRSRAWLNGALMIDSSQTYGVISTVAIYGAGTGSASSVNCEYDDIRIVAGELYSGPTISVPTLPLGVV